MKRIKLLLRLLCALLLTTAIVCALLAAGIKAYSLYDRLVRKMDYTNSLSYEIRETVDHIRQSVNREFVRYSFDYSWVSQSPALIAHAFGGIDTHTYTNSLEAFEHNYALGHRVFEVDLDITDEYFLVASHDQALWRKLVNADDDTAYSYKDFMAARTYGKYTPVDYRNIVDLMIRYPDIYIVTDTKYTDQSTVLLQFSQLVRYAQQTDASVLERIIPQIYHEDMLGWVMSVHPFSSVIYTLYASGSNAQEAYAFCEHSGIRFITAPTAWINQETVSLWKQLDITVAAHTINSSEEMQRLQSLGVDIIYTDFLSPDHL